MRLIPEAVSDAYFSLCQGAGGAHITPASSSACVSRDAAAGELRGQRPCCRCTPAVLPPATAGPPAHTLTNNCSGFLSIHDYIVTLGFAQLSQSMLGHATCPSLQQHYGVRGGNLVRVPEGAGFRALGGKAGGLGMAGPLHCSWTIPLGANFLPGVDGKLLVLAQPCPPWVPEPAAKEINEIN